MEEKIEMLESRVTQLEDFIEALLFELTCSKEDQNFNPIEHDWNKYRKELLNK